MTAGAAFEVVLASFRLAGAPLIVLGFLVGVTTYTLYTLATRIANDRAKPAEMVLVSAGLLFVYCIGAIVAPALASLVMRAFGPSALFCAKRDRACRAIAAFALWRLAVDARPPAKDVGVYSLTTEMSGAAGFFMPTTW